MVSLDRGSVVSGPFIVSASDGRACSADSLVAEVAATKHDVRPFDATSLDLCSELSARLMGMRRHPEAVALGFWMRAAGLARMRSDFEAAIPRNEIAVSRGLAFHVTPANVDTLFVYSWVLSLLVGNANIVRVSSRSNPVRADLLKAITEVLEQPAMAALAARNRFILTEHDDSVLSELSASSDVRVVWGGDSTVRHLRRFGIPVHGRDVVFPDRHSLTILDATSVAHLDESALASLADRFFDDAYVFDQGACSSPRLLIWRGTPDPGETERAVGRFRDAVDAVTKRRHYVAETGMALNKMAFAADIAARIDVVSIEHPSNEVTWVRISDLKAYDRQNCGGGLFVELLSQDIAADLLAMVGPRDQTVATFGIGRDELREIAVLLNGRGVDRIVPVGRALAFDSTWDGSNLLVEFSRRVVINS